MEIKKVQRGLGLVYTSILTALIFLFLINLKIASTVQITFAPAPFESKLSASFPSLLSNLVCISYKLELSFI